MLGSKKYQIYTFFLPFSLIFSPTQILLFIWAGGLTNERPGTDHVTWGPMRGLEKNCTQWRKQTDIQTDRQTDMATLWPTRPSGAELVKIRALAKIFLLNISFLLRVFCCCNLRLQGTSASLPPPQSLISRLGEKIDVSHLMGSNLPLTLVPIA